MLALSLRSTLVLSVGLALAWVSPALAGHHRWDISEVFSNADGSVQFVELFSANSGEAGLNGWTITSSSGGLFTFVGSLSGETANTWVLVGTNAFALADGAPTPDYVLPDGFFDPASDTLSYAGTADVWMISDVPTDGVSSLDRVAGVGVNSPTNFAGETGSIDLTPPDGSPLPTLGIWGLAALVGVLLVAASGLFRRPVATA